MQVCLKFHPNQTFIIEDYTYKSQEEDELDLAVGDVLTIINMDEDDGWHRGILNGRVGLFPANVRFFLFLRFIQF